MKIVVYVDGSKHSRVAVEHACALALGGGYEKGYHVVLVCAVKKIESKRTNPIGKIGKVLHISHTNEHEEAALEEVALEEAQNVIDDHFSMDKCLDTVKTEQHALVGKPAEQIIKLALQHKAQRIVIGIYCTGEKKRYGGHTMRCGPIAKSVIRHVPAGCQVHVVEFGSTVVKRFPVKGIESHDMPKMTKLAEKAGFAKEAAAKLVELFHYYDEDHGGDLDTGELDELFDDIGIDSDDARVKEEVKKVDRDNSGTLEYVEFLRLMVGLNRIFAEERGGNEDDGGVALLSVAKAGKKNHGLKNFLHGVGVALHLASDEEEEIIVE